MEGIISQLVLLMLPAGSIFPEMPSVWIHFNSHEYGTRGFLIFVFAKRCPCEQHVQPRQGLSEKQAVPKEEHTALVLQSSGSTDFSFPHICGWICIFMFIHLASFSFLCMIHLSRGTKMFTFLSERREKTQEFLLFTAAVEISDLSHKCAERLIKGFRIKNQLFQVRITKM